MSHKMAKRIRARVLPERAEIGASRGRFVREQTAYHRRVHREAHVPWPLQQLYGPLVYQYYTDTLDPECPRAYIKKLTRLFNEHRQRSQRAGAA